MVSLLSIIFMAVAGLISVALPVGLFLFWRKKYGLKLIPALVGTAAFIVFAMVLEQLLHFVVLRPEADGTVALISSNPALFVLYVIFAAGIFEETARFVSFKLLNKKFRDFGAALSYGIGHGGIEAVLLLGVASISNIAFSVMINSGSLEALASAGVTAETTAALVETSPYMFLVGGLERVFAVTIHISLSVLVWYAASRKDKIWLYPAAILLHAAANFPAALMQAGVIDSILLVEILTGVSALSIALLTVCAYRKLRGDEVKHHSKTLENKI
jgi:uncharacterized membrane protein YhfC